MSDEPATGPIDFVLIEFPDGADTAATAAELIAVLDLGVVRLYDITGVRRHTDGTLARVELGGGDPALDGFVALAGAQSGLFDDGDIEQAGEILDPGTSALLLAYENTWASGFVTAARAAGGRMIASERIPAQVLLDVLDAADATL